MKDFSYYEFVGVLIPGTILLYGASLIFTDIGPIIFVQNLSIGDFGLFFILAFALGHLAHAFGNGLEYLWWKVCGGMPTDWIRTGKFNFLGKKTREAIEIRVRRYIEMPGFTFDAVDSKEWYSITRRIYAAVEGSGKAKRADIFNGNYSLFRGMAIAFFILAVLILFKNTQNWEWSLASFIGCIGAIYRMNRFGKNYARELFAQFIQIAREPRT
jgi:hypothetical protein